MLRIIVDWLVYGLMHLDTASRAAQAAHFFVYDSLKIILLVFAMIAGIGFLRTFLPHDRVRLWLSGRKTLAYGAASLFGAMTPFCSCSSIPIFFGFVKAGIPLGVTFAFLVTSPLINEYLLILMVAYFGWKIALLYVVNGMALGILAGVILERMKVERLLVKDILPEESQGQGGETYANLAQRAAFGVHEAWSVIKKLWLWILVGVGIGALIHNYVPDQTLHSIIKTTGIFSVPLAVIIGVPLYGSCAAILPIAVVLFQKGIPLGTALAFMMAVASLSLPEAVMLRRAMKLQLILLFFGITALGIIFSGYLFNVLQRVLM